MGAVFMSALSQVNKKQNKTHKKHSLEIPFTDSEKG